MSLNIKRVVVALAKYTRLNKDKNKIYLLFIICFCAKTAFPQLVFTTPEVYSYKQEVFSPVSYYTGQVNVSIPLCEVKTNEITLPISLSYIGGQGLRSTNPYSNVGFGWKLSVGGVITRSKNGVCDEDGSGVQGNPKGFFHFAESNISATSEYVRNNVSNLQNSSNYEYCPDIFSFSFLGYSGYFVLGYDNEFHIQSSDIVSVEKKSTSSTSGVLVYFILTANDGTKYTFGSTNGSVETSGGQNGIPFQSEAWYLTKISFVNGENVVFNYQRNDNVFIHCKSSQYDALTYSTTSPVVLNEITYNGGKVVFTSSNRTHYISGMSDQLRLISKIELKDSSNKTVSSVDLTYQSYVSYRYYLLNSLDVDGKNYTFQYNSPSSLPDYPAALGNDWWGYYNGQPEAVGNLTSGTRDNYLNQTLTQPEKLPSEYHTKLGILNSITFPEGGKETFHYESNTYSRKGRIGNNGYYNSASIDPIPTGGLRIAQIDLDDQVKKYKYVEYLDPDNPDYDPDHMSPINYQSSGILYKSPAISQMPQELLNFLSIEGEPPVVYHRVYELLSDKSYTQYDMYSPLDRPDGKNSVDVANYSVTADNNTIFSYVGAATFVAALGKNSSCALERGMLSEVKYYNSLNRLIRKTNYNYSLDPNRYNDYVTGVYYAGTGVPAVAQRMGWLGYELGNRYFGGTALHFWMAHSYCIYTFPVQMVESVDTRYVNGYEFTEAVKYRYNDQDLKSSVLSYRSDGDSIKTTYRYPADINSGVYANMVTKKMLNFPVEEIYVKNNNITGGTLTTYKVNGESYVPYQVFQIETTSPFAESSFNHFTGSGKDSHYGSYANITFNDYNNVGRLVQYTGRDGIPVSYLWDSSSQYPMAEVKGISHSQISSLEGKQCTYSSQTLWSDINSVGSSGLINTYSYKPLVGISSHTNSQNITSKYVYDKSNRLFLVRDQDGNIVSKYGYGYKGNPDDGMGGYGPITGSIQTNSSDYMVGALASANISASGGSGEFTYSWKAEASASVLATGSGSSFSFTCSRSGTIKITCTVEDSQLGTTKTIIRNVTCSACSITTYSGFNSMSYGITNTGSTVTLYLSLYSGSPMNRYTNYHVADITNVCKPASTRTITVNSEGRTWVVDIYSNGQVHYTMTSGSTLPAYSTLYLGTLTFSL